MNDVARIEGNTQKGSLIKRMAARFGVDDNKLLSTLKKTAFKVKDGEVTNEQLMALMVVADQYNLNPFTREIYAFPDKQNGIVPVVGVDGWSRIINSHDDFDGMEFRASDDIVEMEGAKPCPAWIECSIYRKGRTHPITVREYLDECYRPPFVKNGNPINGPWQTHTKRFLRHKTMIQGARIAFGFAGIFDPDEADRISEAEQVREVPARPQRSHYPAERFNENLPGWRDMVESGKQTPDDIIATLESRHTLSDEQKKQIRDLGVIDVETETEGD